MAWCWWPDIHVLPEHYSIGRSFYLAVFWHLFLKYIHLLFFQVDIFDLVNNSKDNFILESVKTAINSILRWLHFILCNIIFQNPTSHMLMHTLLWLLHQTTLLIIELGWMVKWTDGPEGHSRSPLIQHKTVLPVLDRVDFLGGEFFMFGFLKNMLAISYNQEYLYWNVWILLYLFI